MSESENYPAPVWLRLETANTREAEDAIFLERVAASFEIIRWR